MSDIRRAARELRRLFAWTRPYRGLLVRSWAATAGYAASAALLAYIVKPIFDEVLIRGVSPVRVAATIVALSKRTAVVRIEVVNDGRTVCAAQGTVLVVAPKPDGA